MSVNLGLKREFEWPFNITQTSKGILGADFLHKFGLLFDLRNKQLIDRNTKLAVSADLATVSEDDSVSTLGATC